jgi:hypothetical protein
MEFDDAVIVEFVCPIRDGVIDWSKLTENVEGLSKL